jgi:hypothetical protein
VPFLSIKRSGNPNPVAGAVRRLSPIDWPAWSCGSSAPHPRALAHVHPKRWQEGRRGNPRSLRPTLLAALRVDLSFFDRPIWTGSSNLFATDKIPCGGGHVSNKVRINLGRHESVYDLRADGEAFQRFPVRSASALAPIRHRAELLGLVVSRSFDDSEQSRENLRLRRLNVTPATKTQACNP